MLADARAPVEAAPEPQSDDAEFSWATRDFVPRNLTATVVLSADEVQAQVNEHIKSSVAAGNRPFVLPSQLLLMRTSRADVGNALAYANSLDGFGQRSPFSSIEVRMVPENETVMPRAATSPAAGAASNEKLVTMHHGESLPNLLLTAGVSRASIATILSLLDRHDGQSPIAEGAGSNSCSPKRTSRLPRASWRACRSTTRKRSKRPWR